MLFRKWGKTTEQLWRGMIYVAQHVSLQYLLKIVGSSPHRPLPLEALRIDAVLVHLVVEVLVVDSRRSRGLADVASGVAQAAGEIVVLELLDEPALGGAETLQGSVAVASAEGGRQVGRLDEGTGREEDGALDGVLQLAHVAGVVVGEQQLLGRGGETPALAVLRVEAVEERVGEEEDVAAPVAQGRHRDLDDVQAVEEILP